MVVPASEITFGAAQWSRRAETALGRVPGAADMLADWRAGVVAGNHCLWTIQVNGEARGALVWEVEHLPGRGSALTVLSAACDPVPGVCMAMVIARAFEGLAEKTGVPVLRFITRRPGLRRQMQRAGFVTREIEDQGAMRWTMEKELRRGQQQQQQ